MRDLGWSVCAFDTRMENWISHQRRKAQRRKKGLKRHAESETDTDDDRHTQPRTPQSAKKRKRRFEVLSEEDVAEDPPAAAINVEDSGGESEPEIDHFETHANLIIVDGEDNTMAYAGCLDSEPKIPNNIKAPGGHKYKVGSFKQVEFANMVKNWDSTTLPVDHIFSTPGWKKLTKAQRSLPDLCRSTKCKYFLLMLFLLFAHLTSVPVIVQLSTFGTSTAS